MQKPLTETAAAAVRACIIEKAGHVKLKAKPPRSNTLAYAAYQGMIINFNPYKASVVGIMFMSDEQRAIYREVEAWAEANPQLRGLDSDRLALETLGVW
jgi:hypothetical protein